MINYAGNIIGNSLKTIFSRITTNSSAIGALEDVGISINDLEGNVRPVSEIISELAGKWNTLSDAERQNTAVKTAGVYQLSRFNALMINHDMAIKSTETSMNSFNSASREQAKYNESLQARINRLSNAWYGLADAVGGSVLYDGIVVVTEALKATTNAGSGVASTIGTLAPAFGVLGMAIFGLSGSFRTLITATYSKITAFMAASATNKLYAATFLGLGGAARVATVALRGLMMATVVGAGFAALGFAIEKVVNSMSKMIQRQEEFAQYSKQNTDALTLNKEKTEELISSYLRLRKEKESGRAWSTEKEEKYLGIQNTLAEVFPALIDNIDSTGQAHLKNEEALQKEIAATEKLAEAQNRLTLADATKQFKDFKKELTGGAFSSLGNFVFGNLEDQIKNTQTAIKGLSKRGLDTSKEEIKLINLQRQYQVESEKIKSHIYTIIDAIEDLNDAKIDSNLSKGIKEFVSSLDLSNLSPEELDNFANSVGNLQVQLQSAYASGNSSSFDSLIQELNSLATSSKGFDDEVNGLTLSYEKLNKVIEKGNGYIDGAIGETGEAIVLTSELQDKVSKLAESISELKSVEEQLVGVSNNHVQSSNELLFMYESLTYQLNGLSDSELQALLKKKELTAEEKILVQAMQQRGDVIAQLSALYPQFATLQENQISLSLQQIEAMKQEEKANKVLLESYKLAAEGKYTAEQEMTLAQALATKARIENIKKEIEALNILNQELQKYINNDLTAKDDNVDGKGKAAMRASMLQANNLASIDTRASELSGLQSELSTSIDGLGKINTKIAETSSKASKSSATTTKESLYLSDKFKQSLEAVNLEIEKQQALQAKHPKHSETYRKSLEAQLKLEREKLKLIQDQASALDKQIKAGKIAQTGNVTIGDGNSKSTTSKSKKLSGWEGKITDTYGTYRSIRNGRMHTGVDIAGKTGTRLDSNVSGKVDKVGKTALSGNYVQIIDEKGMKHFYGHLEKIVAEAGKTIKAGMQIGTIGNTGNSTGSHLHYQITDASGKTSDPMQYVTAAKSMVVSSEQISTVVSNTTQSIDDAKSTLVGLQGDALKQMQTIADLEKAIIESQLASFDFKRSGYDEIIGFEQAKLKNVTVGTTQYNKTMEKQATLLKAKQKVNNDELAYVEGLIKSGNLSAITLEQMKSRTMELKTAMQLLNAELGNLALDKIIDAHDAYTQKQDNTIDFEKNKLNELDKNSSRYGATLEKLNTHMNRKILTHQDTIKSIENEIKVLGLQGDALKRAKDTIQSLTLEMQNFKQEMSDNNYEIIVNVKTRYDEKNDDIQFEIDRSKAIQALYKEGSADAANEIRKQIGWQEELVKSYDASRKALQAELNNRDLLPERIKEITELMEDETIAYWNAKRAVEELNESLEETRKKLLNDIADKFINAYKQVIQEQRDMKLDAIDDEIEAYEKAHEKRMKQLKDEMDLFRKNVEEMLRLIDRQEAERSFQMDIDEMNVERDKLVDQINLLSMDDSHEAKSKRKKLLEQLDKLDKDIKEKYHQRDIELQKQELNDLLENKETEIELKEESLDEQNKATLDSLREQRKYWEQHFKDLENDQRKFNQIREDILNGHFDKVLNEFNGYIEEMKATMPSLENTLNGTMQAVGTAIRKNVIEEIEAAIKAMQDFQNMQTALNTHVDDFNPNANKDTSYQGNTGNKPTNNTPSPSNNNSNNSGGNKTPVYASLNRGDLQVLFGKYINDVVAPTFKAETKERIALKAEGERLAALGRNNSSQIPVSSPFGSEISKLTSSQIEQLKSFVKSNGGSLLGGHYVNAFNKNLASLHTGGMTKYNGTGNDGIGGKLAMLHPNEIVLNPLQSDEMLKSSSIIQNIMKMITPVISKLPTPSSITNNNSQPHIEINFTGAIHNSNGRTGKDLANEIGNAMRTKGMSF